MFLRMNSYVLRTSSSVSVGEPMMKEHATGIPCRWRVSMAFWFISAVVPLFRNCRILFEPDSAPKLVAATFILFKFVANSSSTRFALTEKLNDTLSHILRFSTSSTTFLKRGLLATKRSSQKGILCTSGKHSRIHSISLTTYSALKKRVLSQNAELLQKAHLYGQPRDENMYGVCPLSLKGKGRVSSWAISSLLFVVMLLPFSWNTIPLMLLKSSSLSLNP